MTDDMARKKRPRFRRVAVMTAAHHFDERREQARASRPCRARRIVLCDNAARDRRHDYRVALQLLQADRPGGTMGTASRRHRVAHLRADA